MNILETIILIMLGHFAGKYMYILYYNLKYEDKIQIKLTEAIRDTIFVYLCYCYILKD